MRQAEARPEAPTPQGQHGTFLTGSPGFVPLKQADPLEVFAIGEVGGTLFPSVPQHLAFSNNLGHSSLHQSLLNAGSPGRTREAPPAALDPLHQVNDPFQQLGGVVYQPFELGPSRSAKVRDRISSNFFARSYDVTCETVAAGCRVAGNILPPLQFLLPATRRSVDQPTATTLFALHPHLHVIAVATQVGSTELSEIRVFELSKPRPNLADAVDLPSQQHLDLLDPAYTLSSSMLKGVSAISWKPHSRDVLAIAVRGGVTLWHLRFRADSFNIVSDGAHTMERQQLGSFLIYPFPSARSLITSLSFSTSTGRYLAVGSCEFAGVAVFDVSQPPNKARKQLLFSKKYPVATTQVCQFSLDDALLFRALRDTPSLSVFETSTFTEHSLTTTNPVTSLAMADPSSLGSYRLVLVTDKTEGIILVDLRLIAGTGVARSSLESYVVAKISTERLSRGVGGIVKAMTCDLTNGGRRIAIGLECGRIALLDVSLPRDEISGGSTNGRHYHEQIQPSVTLVGCFDMRSCEDAKAPRQLVSMTYFDKSSGLRTEEMRSAMSLLAVLDDKGTLRFVPSYYKRC